MPYPIANARQQRGFTLMEMAVVLVIIALILGGVSVGRDVYRSAQAERISSEFVQGWIIAYESYVQRTGHVPGDTPAAATGKVNAKLDDPLCDDSMSRMLLRDTMLTAGISLPPGRAEGQESRAVYLDANGSPQQLQVCFVHIKDWAEPAAGGRYIERPRNVLWLRGMTAEFARQLDQRIDGRVDARQGRLRERNVHGPNGLSLTTQTPWSADAGMQPVDRNAPVAVMDAYLKMSQ